MRTRRFLLLPLLALACSHAPAPAEAPAADPTAAIRALADSHAQGLLRLDPLLATMVGDHRYDDRLPDTLTDAGIAATRKLNENTRAQLQRIPRSALSGEDALTWEVLDDMTRTALDGLAFGDPLIPLDHNNALAIQMPVLGSGEGMHPFQTVADYDHFLARIGAFDQWVNAAIANMRRGISSGYTQPKVVIQRAIPQLEAQIVARPEDSAFWGPITRMPSGFSPADRERLTAAYRQAISGTLVPAYRRLRDFARDTYLPACRTTTAAEALPDGVARYAYLVRSQTTSTLTAHQIHELGLSEVKRISGEIERIAGEQGFQGTAAEYIVMLRKSPADPAHDASELLARYQRFKATVEPKLPTLFSRLPKADFEVRLIEPYREASASSQYTPATLDGSRAGVFYVNASELKHRPISASAALFLHEALPGHHFQIALTNENAALPLLRRIAQYNAYIEGWGLYAETLGGPLGLYQTTYATVGGLAAELLRAVRLVSDTGLHHEGWSRDRAVQYGLQATGFTQASVEREVDRYIGSPAQALGYKVGQLSILALRKKAESALGSRFDLRAFHDAVLESGPLPLALLETKMAAWTAERSKVARRQ